MATGTECDVMCGWMGVSKNKLRYWYRFIRHAGQKKKERGFLVGYLPAYGRLLHVMGHDAARYSAHGHSAGAVFILECFFFLVYICMHA